MESFKRKEKVPSSKDDWKNNTVELSDSEESKQKDPQELEKNNDKENSEEQQIDLSSKENGNEQTTKKEESESKNSRAFCLSHSIYIHGWSHSVLMAYSLNTSNRSFCLDSFLRNLRKFSISFLFDLVSEISLFNFSLSSNIEFRGIAGTFSDPRTFTGASK